MKPELGVASVSNGATGMKSRSPPVGRPPRISGRNVVLRSRFIPFFACRTNVRPRCKRGAFRLAYYRDVPSGPPHTRFRPYRKKPLSEPLRSILDPGTLPGYTLFRERAGTVTQEPGLQADESAAFHRAGAGGEQAPLGGGDLRPGKGRVPGSGTLHGVPDAGPVARAWDRAQGGLRRGIFALRARDRADAPPRTLRRVRRGYRVQRRANGVPGAAGRAGDRFRHRLARDNVARSLRKLFLGLLFPEDPQYGGGSQQSSAHDVRSPVRPEIDPAR